MFVLVSDAVSDRRPSDGGVPGSGRCVHGRAQEKVVEASKHLFPPSEEGENEKLLTKQKVTFQEEKKNVKT